MDHTTMPQPAALTSRPQFSAASFCCSTFMSVAFSVAFLAVGVHYKQACCDKPLASWNIAFGAIGLGVAFLSVAAVVLGKRKAQHMAKEKAEERGVPTHGPDGVQLTKAQRDAISKLVREHEAEKARATAMYQGPVGKVYAAVQSVQSLYNLIMVIIGSSYVWTTYPNDVCNIVEPQGCDPFLWSWTQGWIIAHYVLGGLLCCLLCCGVCIIGGVAASAGLASQDGQKEAHAEGKDGQHTGAGAAGAPHPGQIV